MALARVPARLEEARELAVGTGSCEVRGGARVGAGTGSCETRGGARACPGEACWRIQARSSRKEASSSFSGEARFSGSTATGEAFVASLAFSGEAFAKSGYFFCVGPSSCFSAGDVLRRVGTGDFGVFETVGTGEWIVTTCSKTSSSSRKSSRLFMMRQTLPSRSGRLAGVSRTTSDF